MSPALFIAVSIVAAVIIGIGLLAFLDAELFRGSHRTADVWFDFILIETIGFAVAYYAYSHAPLSIFAKGVS